MEIEIRWAICGRFADVFAVQGGSRVAAEFLDAKERKELANHLREVADELCCEDEEEPTDASD